MNMVRSMLLEKQIPKSFWPEAVNWAVHVLNRSPTLAVKNKTPAEAWNGIKPSVAHFRVFGCISHVPVPDHRRVKLDAKSLKCVFLGVSENSKAYRFFDPISQKIIISRDVVFEEDQKWNWDDIPKPVTTNDFAWEVTDNEDESPILAELVENEPTQTFFPAESSNADVATLDEHGTTHANVEAHRLVNSEPTIVEGRTRRRPAWLTNYETDQSFFTATDVNIAHLVLFTNGDPTTFEEAVKSENWRYAMNQKIAAIVKNETWELTTLPVGGKTVGVKWIFKTKLNELGEVDKYKARLVAKGYSQQYRVDYAEIFAPVARLDTIRMVISFAAHQSWLIYQLDVKSAFLHGEISEEVFVDQPPGYEQKGEETKVYRLKKALYGLKQAPRAWYSRIESYFFKEGFTKCPYEHTLFIKTADGGKILIICLYVDDLIFTGNDEVMFDEFKKSMMAEFDMSDLGKMRYFLSIEVLQKEGGIFISQQKYTNEVLERFNMGQCNSVKNPIVPGFKLTKDEGGVQVDSTLYKQMVESLMYLTATRLDLMFVVSLISRYMEHPTESHMLATKRILRYVKGTTKFRMFYRKGGDIEFCGYTDSDYAGDQDDRKSISGYVFMMNSSAISWSSKKQPVVTLSTTEAEFIAAASSACQVVWLRRILKSLTHVLSGPTVVYCDNISAIRLSKNPVMYGRSKHIDIRFHFLRDLVKDGVIELTQCSTHEQVADIMTKPLKIEVFSKIRESMGVCEYSE